MTMFELGENYHMFFVFSENVTLDESGLSVQVSPEYEVNLMNNLVQFTKNPLTPKCPSYSMKVKKINLRASSQKTYILFGLTAKCYIGHPTWMIKQSIRYHSDTGGVFNGGPGLYSDNPYAEGDTLTCAIEHFSAEKALVNFIKNGRLVFRQWVNLPDDQLYPTIGFENGPIEISVDWPLSELPPPKFNKGDLRQWVGFKFISYDVLSQTFTLNDYDDTERLAFVTQAPRPLNKEKPYFEVEIMKMNDHIAGMAMGVTGAMADKFRMPGWDPPSIGYHCDDGTIMHGTGIGNDFQSDEHKCKPGDRLGCGIIYLSDNPEVTETSEQCVLVYFTKNDQVFFHKCVLQHLGGFYPTIGFCTKGDEVKVFTDPKPPKITEAQIKDWSQSREVFQSFRYHPAVEFIDFEKYHGRKVRQKKNQERVTLVQYIKKPLSSSHPYFKARILEKGDNGCVCIGVATKEFQSSDKHLGHDDYSCGYGGKAGVIRTKDVKLFTEPLRVGDEVGCYLEYSSLTCHVLVFIKNKTIFHRVRVPSNGEKMYASLTFDTTIDDRPVGVEVTWPDMVKEDEIPNMEMQTLSSWILPKGLHQNDGQIRLGHKDDYTSHINAQASQPLTKSGVTYFEVKFISSVFDTIPTIGVSSATLHHDTKLGQDQGTVAYLPAEGKMLDSSNMAQFQMDDHFKCIISDRAGCGIVFFESVDLAGREEQSVIIYFTKNGEVVYHDVIKMKLGGLYPTVCFEKEGDVVEIDTGAESSVQQAIVNEWIKEANMNLHINKANTADYGRDLMADLIEYTNVVDDFKQEYNVKTIDNYSNKSKLVVYISHSSNADDMEKAKWLLEALSAEGVIVEMSMWNRSLEDVSQKSDDADAIIVCLSNSYIHEDARFQEFIILKSKGKPLVPIVLQQMTWPPLGNISAFKGDFLNVEHLKIDAADSILNAGQVLQKVKLACAEHQKSSSDQLVEELRPLRNRTANRSGRGMDEHYYPRAGNGHYDSSSIGDSDSYQVRTVVCNIL